MLSSSRPIWYITAAAAVGSIIEWYDLFVYGSLVVILSRVFFPEQNPALSVLYAIAAFVAGAAVRPFGGLVFGRIGDRVGRKYAFLLTIVVMGVGAVTTGLLPTYATAGILAPLSLMTLRVIQGLALGGEWGGASIYIAEHVPDERRGYWTSFIQATATLGLLISSGVVLAIRLSLGQAAFGEWGWRIPFLLSAVLVGIAIFMRMKLKETPLFTKLKEMRNTSASPIKEAFGSKSNLKLMLVALLVVSGSSVVWHTGQFYANIYMQTTLKIDFVSSSTVTLIALAAGAPFFILFGWLSDKIGRKKILLLGSLFAAISYLPLYIGMKEFSNPPNVPVLTGLLFFQIFFSAMCYGPLSAFLVELFPAKVRYTSMSVPYGIGTGDVGDGTVLISPAIVVATGNIFSGLVWPIAIPLLTFCLGLLYLRESRETKIWKEVEQKAEEE
jgi:MFS family permease